MLDPFSHLLLVINSALNIVFYGIFNQKFREVAKKEFVRCFPKTAARLSPSKSKRVIASTTRPVLSHQNNRHGLAKEITQMTEISNNVGKIEMAEMMNMSDKAIKNDELIPLKSTELPTQDFTSINVENGNSMNKESGAMTVPPSFANLNNKLLTDSSTQIPNSECTTNLKRTSTKEQNVNNHKKGTIDIIDASKGSSIKSTSSISKKTSANDECLNIEKHLVEKADLESINKYPKTFQSVESNGKGDNNERLKKVLMI